VNETSRERWRATRALRPRALNLNQSKPTALCIANFVFCLFWAILPAQAQQESQQLSPSEALRWAMDPFNQARSQNGDLTDADKLALSLGESRAAQDCLALTASPQSTLSDPAELLALGKLCLFGQQFEPARATLVNYLALPTPPEREIALILLSRAFLGLRSPGSVAIQVLTLIRDYPYDAEVQLAADQAISACEEENYAVPGTYVTEICKKQLAVALPLLSQGKPLPGKDETILPARLYADAIRCARLAQDAKDQSDDNSLKAIWRRFSSNRIGKAPPIYRPCNMHLRVRK
jgi:hypothetical protein